MEFITGDHNYGSAPAKYKEGADRREELKWRYITDWMGSVKCKLKKEKVWAFFFCFF